MVFVKGRGGLLYSAVPTSLVLYMVWRVSWVTGQLADKPTRGQSSRGLVNSRTSQLAEMFDSKIGVYNSFKCYFGQITLFIRCQYSIGLELGLVLG